MKRYAVVLLLLLLLLVPAGVALAAPPFDTVVEAGETVNNDVILFDGDLRIEEGASVRGNVTLFNGNAYVAGTVHGDLVLFNGNLEAENTAVINGDCVLLNGTLTSSEAGLSCTNIANLPAFIPALPHSLRSFTPFIRGESFSMPPVSHHFWGGLGATAGRSLLLALVAFVIGALLPDHLRQVERTARRKPLASGAVGLLTAIAIPSLVALLIPVSIILLFVCIGILGFPIMFILLVGLAAGALFGWVTMGNLLGRWLMRLLNVQKPTPALTAALGTAVLTFAIGLLGLIPYVFGNGLIAFILLCVGLGATALTQFGAKPYPPEETLEDDEKVKAVLTTLPNDL